MVGRKINPKVIEPVGRSSSVRQIRCQTAGAAPCHDTPRTTKVTISMATNRARRIRRFDGTVVTVQDITLAWQIEVRLYRKTVSTGRGRLPQGSRARPGSATEGLRRQVSADPGTAPATGRVHRAGGVTLAPDGPGQCLSGLPAFLHGACIVFLLRLVHHVCE